jgi:hypothetical protein
MTLDLTSPLPDGYNRRRHSVALQFNSGDVAAGSRGFGMAERFTHHLLNHQWDHEVEVLPCERDANPGN